MRVLIVSHSSELIHPGGAESASTAQAEVFRSQGHEVTHLACIPELDTDFGFDENSNTHLIRSNTQDSSYLWGDHRTQLLWAERINEFRPDVVHLHHYLHVGILLPALIKRILPDCKVVLTLHEYLAICGQSGQMLDKYGQLCSKSGIRKCSNCLNSSAASVALNKSLIRLGFSYVDTFISPSDFLLKRYVQWGMSAEKIRKIENFKREMPSPDAIPTVLNGHYPLVMNFMSQHTPTKGLDVLLQAILDLQVISPSTLKKVRFNIWGSGSERWKNDFHAKILSLRDQVKDYAFFKGSYSRENLLTAYQGASYTIVPSIWWENAPLVIDESLSLGIPVIGSDIGGIAEMLSKSPNNLLFAAGDSVSLARAIVRALETQSFQLSYLPIDSRQATYEKLLQIYLPEQQGSNLRANGNFRGGQK